MNGSPENMFDGKLLLDTCALLWLASDDPHLSSAARQRIERASIVFVSAISAWEISLKVCRNALQLPLEAGDWFDRVCDNHNVTVAPLDTDILIASNNLPPHHKDPADRFIIATAVKEKTAIVTADRRFADYGVKIFI